MGANATPKIFISIVRRDAAEIYDFVYHYVPIVTNLSLFPVACTKPGRLERLPWQIDGGRWQEDSLVARGGRSAGSPGGDMPGHTKG